MSYDLVLWQPAKPLTAKAAAAVYASLPQTDALDETPAIARAYAELVARWAELADADDEDSTPWAAKIERSPRHLALAMSFSYVDEVLDDILAIAKKHGLDAYDPQKRSVVSASAPTKAKAPAPAKDARLTPKQIVQGLRDTMTPILAKHGFAPATDHRSSFVAFARSAKKGVEQRLMFQSGHARNEARLWFAVVNDDVAKLLEPHWPWPRPPWAVDAQLLGYYRDPDGRITKRPEILKRFEFEVCHADCLAKASKQFDADITEYGVPALDALDTTKNLDGFFNGDPSSILMQYVHEYTASRFVAVALGALTGRADLADVISRARAVTTKRASDWHSATKPIPEAFDALVRALPTR